MTEQVQFSLENSNSFKKFALTQNRGKNFYIAPKSIDTTEDIVTLSASDDEAEKITPQKKSHKKRNIALSVGTSALAVGGGVLVLTKGLPKNTQKYLEKLKTFLEKKLEKSTSDKWGEFWEYTIRKVDAFTEKSQSMNNFTTLKDIVFKWAMNLTGPTAKVHKGITDFFEKVARRTVTSAYKTANKKFDNMYKTFDKLDEYILKTNPDEIIQYNGVDYTKRQLIELARSHREKIKVDVSDFTSEASCQSRYEYIKKATEALYSDFLNKVTNNFWSKENVFLKKEMWQTYIPDMQIRGNKKSLNEEVANLRNRISYTDKDKTEVISRHLKTLKKLIPPSDKEGLEIIKKLEWYTNNPEGLKENADIFEKMLISIKDRPLEKGLEEVVEQNQQNLKELSITSIKDLLDEKNIGELQKMLSIYRRFAPEMDKFKAETSVRKAVASFDKAVKTETTEFFDKVRDLQLGSAPTDIIGIAAPAAMIGYGLAEAEDKDERKSVMYKAGIPVLGSIATTIYCTTKLISGGVSLAFAGITGLLFSAIGSGVDKYRHKIPAKNHTNG